MNVLDTLAAAGLAAKRKERNNVYLECPQCGKDNLSVCLYSGVWHCWTTECEVRAFRGVFPDLAQIFKFQVPENLELAAPPQEDKTLSEDAIRAILHSNTNKAEVIQWAVSRALDPTFVIAQGVGYDANLRAIVFPFRDLKGNLIGAKYRGVDRPDQWIKGVEPEIYVLDTSDLKQEKIVIVEGEVDALTLKQIGIPCVATLGAGKEKGFGALARVRQVYLGYDMDGAGDAGAEKAAAALGRYRCKRISWGDKDPNDMLQRGATPEDILKCVREATSMATDLKSKSAKETLSEYLTQLQKAPKKRLSWGYPRLDSFTHGIGGGMYIGVLAEAGTGKTTFILNAARNLAFQGVNVGIASLEEHAINEITPKLAAIIAGRNPGTQGFFFPQEVDGMQAELSRIQLYDGDEQVESVVEWIRECYFTHDVKAVFIDYLQLMVPDEKDVQQLKEVCYTFKKLVKEMPELMIVMIIQPKQKQRMFTKDGKEAKAMRMDGSDARGGAAINQSVDAMLTIKGLEHHPNTTQFEYTKVRGHLRVSKRDWLNQFTQLDYDHATLRQVERVDLIYGGV